MQPDQTKARIMHHKNARSIVDRFLDWIPLNQNHTKKRPNKCKIEL